MVSLSPDWTRFLEEEAAQNGQPAPVYTSQTLAPAQPYKPAGVNLNSASQAIIGNAGMTEQDARFDASTDPAQRGGVGIFGGLANIGRAAVSEIKPLVDLAEYGANAVNQTVATQNTASNPFAVTNAAGVGAQGGVGEPVLGDIAATLIPQTPLDVALSLPIGRLAGVSLGLTDDAVRGGRMLEQGFGANLDTLGQSVQALDELPTGGIRSVLQNPGGGEAIIPRHFPANVAETLPEGIRVGGGAPTEAESVVKPLRRPGGGFKPEETAGNIRLEKYPEDVRAELKTWADENTDVIDTARRGTRDAATTLDAARKLVEETGGDFTRLQRSWKAGEAWNAEEVTAIRGTLRTKTQNVLDAAKAAQADNSAANHLRLLEAMQEQARVQEIVTGVTSEAGRALQSFKQEAFDAIKSNDARKMEELLKRVGDRSKLDNMAAAIAALDINNPYAVNQFIRDISKPKLTDYIYEVYINGILSGPKTHLINGISNTVNALMSAPERAVSAGVESIVAPLSGRSRQRFFDEVPADVFGAISGLDEGVRGALDTLVHGISPAAASKWEFKPNAFKGPVGRAINAPTTALEAADTFFYAVNYRAALNASIVRQAKTDGLTGDALASRIADLKASPTEALIKQAKDAAEYRLFRSDAGSITSWLMQGREKVPGLRYILPFLKTPSNILKAGIEHSPAALLDFTNAGIWRKLAAKNPEASDQIAKVLTGTMLASGLALVVAKGNITGAVPNTAGARDRFYREGKQPFSIKIGDTWVQYQRIEPFNMALTQVSAVVDAVKSGKSVDEAASQAVSTIVRNVADQSYLTGISNILSAIEDPEGSAAESFIRRQASGLVPFSSALRTAAQTVDPVIRDPENLGESLKTMIPGLSDDVPARQTAFGEEAKRQSPALSPIQVSSDKTTAVDAELGRLGVEVGFVGNSIAGYKLNRKEQAKYQELAGQVTEQVLSALISSDKYKAMSNREKEQAIEAAVSKSRNRVRDFVLEKAKVGEFP